ncbi:MAG: Acyl carrier protein [Candidatus Ordinivivax streblomastigis]|uniref:Acyl carrier protein n=1 Tax=Candidatus Ordinivivax streblomastigis TaxID=2540710 RepID=A0A5M8NUP9_9BACT|nr:MAG: Acyl carrier protein [Candidatus Ordinivivax streblomastigis]
MNKQEIIEKINNALAEEYEVDLSKITPEANIKDTFDLDSLSFVDMIALVEDVSGMEIKDTDVVSIATFENLYESCLRGFVNHAEK